MVDGRFVLKITDFGLHALRTVDPDVEEGSYAYYRSKVIGHNYVITCSSHKLYFSWISSTFRVSSRKDYNAMLYSNENTRINRSEHLVYVWFKITLLLNHL